MIVIVKYLFLKKISTTLEIIIKILNEFRDIKKSYKNNVNDTTDDYYKTNKLCVKKHCTVLLLDDYDHSKMFICKKNLYYTSKDCKYLGVDVDDYQFNDYEFFDEDYENYDYDDDYCVYDDNDFYDDDCYDNDYLYYKKPFNKFERVVFVKNYIVNLINNDDNDTKPLLSAKEITLSIENTNLFIYENTY